MDWPSDASLRWLVRRYASLLARDGAGANARRLVLPTSEFFPDPFDGDTGSVNLLFWRLQQHTGLTDLDVELRFVQDSAADHTCGCSSGGCSTTGHGCHDGPTLARIETLADGAHRIDVRLSDARSSVTLTAALATSLAHAFVLDSGGFDPWPESEWMATCELAAVSLGLGVIVANASYIYAKGCGGVHVDQRTALAVSELAVALALFAALHERTAVHASEHLQATQRAAYREAKTWVQSNPKLVRRLQRDPASVAADESLPVQEARPWLARVLGLGAKKATSDAFDEESLASLEASMAAQQRERNNTAPNPEKDAKLAEIRALVDESLEELRPSR